MVNELLLQKWSIEFKKGFSKPLILYALDKVGQSYPYLLTKKIVELTNGQISIAGSNIYPILAKLEEEGLILSHIDENERKYYTLSSEGKKFLSELDILIHEFSNTILNLK